MKFECLEGRIFGARYYTVGLPPDYWWYGGPSQSWADMQEWATETFGPMPDNGIWTPGERWYVNNGKFWFREEKDKILFLLKWS